MESLPSSNRRFIPFKKRMALLGFQHAVAFSGYNLLCLILETLICGDINNIRDSVKAALKTNTQYKNSFTNYEQQCLKNQNYKDWDITLLFKVIQKVCGFHPAGHPSWTQPTGDNEALEYLISTVKNWRNELVHDMNLVYSEDQMQDRLNELRELAGNMITVLGDRAQTQGKQLSTYESDEVLRAVFDIIEDVKATINESAAEEIPPNQPALSYPSGAVPEGFDSDTDSEEDDEEDYASDRVQFDSVQFDSVFEPTGAWGQAPQEPSMDEVFLEQEFWKFVGPRHTMA